MIALSLSLVATPTAPQVSGAVTAGAINMEDATTALVMENDTELDMEAV